jgi:hypothetical protein
LLTKSGRYYYDQDAIREPIAVSSKQRINQPNFDNQTGGPKDYRNGINSNRSARNTLENFKKSAGQGRNKRSVWTVNTKPYKSAHFAVFPPALIEPCILAGCPAQVCVECGEPWVRVVETPKPPLDVFTETSKPKDGFVSVNVTGKGMGRKYQNWRNANPAKTLHFAPTCQCCPLPAVKIDKFGYQWPIYRVTRPGVVLDPFFGSGTVAEVAIDTGRDWLGIELNPDYIELAKDRIYKTQPALFAR